MTDGEVVAQVLAGNQRAFAQVVRRYHERCYRFALRMLGNRQDAEDAVQETFIRAYRSLGSYEERGRFEPWLWRILMNRCRSVAVAVGRSRRVETMDDGAAGRLGTEGPDLARMTWRREIGRALQRLSPDAREAFVLKYVEELSYPEMAVVTGVGVSALKMRVMRAREDLRNMLKDLLHDD